MSESITDARTIRHAGRATLARALADARERLLCLWQAYSQALAGSGFEVRYLTELNPPLWELGHIAWFEEYWLGRNPQRLAGTAAEPEAARAASILPQADALYHSGQVAHARRWHLDLPDERRTLAYAAEVRERTLALLAESAEDDAALYFFRLALHHEDMHREAWVYMAQTLGMALGDAADGALDGHDGPAPGPVGEWAVPAQTLVVGSGPEGFAFDNELGAHEVAVPAFTIDRAPVTWGRYLPFVEAGGYHDAKWWSAEGWDWHQRHAPARPRHLAPDESGLWKRAAFGRWQAVDKDEPALHLSAHEARAWCRWAGRRLPTEAEWDAAARLAGLDAAGGAETFAWGQVWEWTASAFAPYPGFVAHPYRDYSAPWFDGRPVLRGASFATAPRMKYALYRNYFTTDRNDIFAGIRSCAA